MKKYFIFLCSILFVSILHAQDTYTGNTRNGYGGAVGNGSLQISSDESGFNFKLKKGGGDLNDAVVIYLDTKPGGYASTANFTDEGDGLRKAISGVQGSDRATLTFPENFNPGYAIAFDKGFAGVWQLAENGSHQYKNSANLNPTNTSTAPEYTFSVAMADIDLSPGIGFKFLVTYVSESGYRSNEFIGDNGPVNNPQNGPYTATGYAVYGSALPIGFSSMSAQSVNGSVRISWKATDETAGGHYEIERSGNASGFYPIGEIIPNNSSNYIFQDQNPLNGNNYYRICFQDPAGKKTYSKTVSLNIIPRETFKAYVSGNRLVLKLNFPDKGNYQLAMVNASGQAVLLKDINYDGSQNNFDINLDNQLSPGIYSIIIKGNSSSESSQVLIK